MARDRFGEIWPCGPRTWRVPSSEAASKMVYLVDLGLESCSCEDFRRREEPCKHVYGARTVRAKTAPCDGCRRRFAHRDLIEVTEDHESLTFFEGDLLCEECAIGAGAL